MEYVKNTRITVLKIKLFSCQLQKTVKISNLEKVLRTCHKSWNYFKGTSKILLVCLTSKHALSNFERMMEKPSTQADAL